MTKLSSLSILIPCYNNEDTINDVLQESVEIGNTCAKVFEVIVIDDGSSDTSVELIESFAKKSSKITLIRHNENQGFGKTIKELYYLSKEDFAFSIPGDRQIRADSLFTLMTKIDRCSMVIGYRLHRNDNIFRKFQSFFYNALLRLFFRINLHDVNSTKLFRCKILDEIKLAADSAFVDAEFCIKTVRKGLKVGEVEISHYPGEKGGGGAHLKTVIPSVKDLIIFILMDKFGLLVC